MGRSLTEGTLAEVCSLVTDGTHDTPKKVPSGGKQEVAAPTPAAPSPAAARPAALPLPLDLLRRAIEEASDEQGWAHLAAVGSYVTKIRPDFDPRLYGHRKLSDLVKAHARHFGIDERGGAGGSKSLYVRALD